jgi:hypothetical protein
MYREIKHFKNANTFNKVNSIASLSTNEIITSVHPNYTNTFGNSLIIWDYSTVR